MINQIKTRPPTSNCTSMNTLICLVLTSLNQDDIIYLSICLCPSVRPSVTFFIPLLFYCAIYHFIIVPVCLSIVYRFIFFCLSYHSVFILSNVLSFCLSFYLSFYVLFYYFVCLSIILSIVISFYLFIVMSVCLCYLAISLII